MKLLSMIPAVILLIVTTASVVGGGALKNHFSKNVSSSLRWHYIFSAVSSVFSAVTIFAVGGFDTTASRFSVLLGLLFGIVIALQFIAFNEALCYGPWSYTTVIVSLSTVISAMSGVFLNGEVPSVFKYVGLVFMILCFVFSAKTDEKQDNRKANLAWILLSVLASLLCGGIGILQKAHQSSAEHKGEIVMFLVSAFIFSAVFSAVMAWICSLREKRGKKAEKAEEKRVLAFGIPAIAGIFILAGVLNGLNHIINLYLIGVIESALIFPLVNGADLIVATVLSVVLFKEKLSVKQWIGLAFGIIAVVILCF